MSGRSSIPIAHATYPDNSIPVGYIDFLLGYASWKSDDSVNADELMKRGVHELEMQVGWGHPTYLRVLRQYQGYLSQTGRKGEAKQLEGKLKKLEHSGDSTVAQTGNLAIAGK